MVPTSDIEPMGNGSGKRLIIVPSPDLCDLLFLLTIEAREGFERFTSTLIYGTTYQDIDASR
uniref:Uncharacterized protein n=1 Tax=Solanum demissum TaxID=50514 RepID=Q0KIV6_SOLDE|nr:hypothetical protein SDM1_22t00001 [Solanum demissum]